jgi:CPA2 family monovalent cation:H+ antiporter-2
LRANKIKTTILDYDSDRIDLLRKMGFKVYIMEMQPDGIIAGLRKCESFIAAIDNPVNLQVIEVLKNTSQI